MIEVRVLGAARPWPKPRQRPRRRSRLIDVLRILLPVLALILVGLVIIWPQIVPGPAGIAVPTLLSGEGDQPDRLRMDSPRYVGRTSDDRPYEVTARSASLDPLATNVVHLDQPSADVALGEGGNVHVMAQNGTYDRAAGKLLLDGGIEVVTSDGYRFVTPSARVHLAQGRIRGWQPIEGVGPTGRLSADRFEIKDAGDVLRFDGRVRVTLVPPPEREARPAEQPRPDAGASS